MSLNLKEKAAFSIGAVGKDIVYTLSASYVLYYYQDLLGVSAIFMGALLLIARIFDAVNDPVMGVVVAKTKTKFGRFRPWLFTGTTLNAVVLYLMFSVPEVTQGLGLLVWASSTYILWGLTYTMMDIPYWSMIPAFTSGTKERESLATLGRTMAGVGAAIATVATMPLVTMLGGGNEVVGFKWFSLIVAIFFFITALIMCFFIKEKSTVDMPTTSVKEMFKALLQNDQAMAIVISIVLINCSVYLTSNLVIYFFKYDFGGENWISSYTMFNIFGGAVQILSMMVIYPLLRKFLSNTKTFFAALAMAVLGYAVLFLIAFTTMNNVFILFIPGFLIFAGNGVLTVLTTIFLANTCDYGELKNGRRDESVIFSMQTFVVKFAAGIAVFLAGVCLDIFKISENTDIEAAVTSSSVIGLRMTMTILPAIGLVIAALYFGKKFKLDDKKMAEIEANLKEIKK